jgi:hypothetical protein
MDETSHPLAKHAAADLACVVAGVAAGLTYDAGGLAFLTAMLITLLFLLTMLAGVRWAIVFAFAISLLQPMLTRFVFSVDFSSAAEQSMLDYKDPLTTFVSLLLITVALLALVGHMSRSGKRAPLGIVGAVGLYAMANFVQIFNPNTSLTIGVYGAKNNVLPVLMLFAGSLVVHTPDNTVRFVKFIAWFSVAALTYGLYQEIVGLPAFDSFWY